MDDNAHRLIASCQGLVRTIAWEIHCRVPRHIELDELVAYGNLGLTQAAREFDATRGWKFTTYAYHRIRGAILDGLKQMSWFKIADYHRGRYEHLAQDAVQAQWDAEPAHAPSDWESDLPWFQHACGQLAIVRLLCQRDDETQGLTDARESPPPEVLIARETREQLRQLVDALPPPADTLIRSAYYEGLTLKEAGERLGRSKAWASRLHAKALEQLARKLEGLENAARAGALPGPSVQPAGA